MAPELKSSARVTYDEKVMVTLVGHLLAHSTCFHHLYLESLLCGMLYLILLSMHHLSLCSKDCYILCRHAYNVCFHLKAHVSH